MYTYTVFSLFDTHAEANNALIALGNLGFTTDEVSVLAQEAALNPKEEAPSAAETGAVGGAAIGGIAGIIAAAIGITIPPFGALLGAGFLAGLLGTTVAVAGVGFVAGGLLGALADLGAPEEHIAAYEKGVGHGKILVSVRTRRQDKDEVVETLLNYGGQEVHAYQTEAIKVRARQK